MAGEVIKFIKVTMKIWIVELSVRGKKLAEVKIKIGIFQGDALSPLLFVIIMMSLSHMFRKCTWGDKLHKSEENINHLMNIDSIKLSATNEKLLEILIEVGRINSPDIEMEFGIKKCLMLIMSRGKQQMTKGLEQPNQENMGTLREKGNLQILRNIGNKQH